MVEDVESDFVKGLVPVAVCETVTKEFIMKSEDEELDALLVEVSQQFEAVTFQQGEGTSSKQQGLLITSEPASCTEEVSKQYGESKITTLTSCLYCYLHYVLSPISPLSYLCSLLILTTSPLVLWLILRDLVLSK